MCATMAPNLLTHRCSRLREQKLPPPAMEHSRADTSHPLLGGRSRSGPQLPEQYLVFPATWQPWPLEQASPHEAAVTGPGPRPSGFLTTLSQPAPPTGAAACCASTAMRLFRGGGRGKNFCAWPCRCAP